MPDQGLRTWRTGGVRIRFGDFELDTSVHELRHGDEVVTVEPQVKVNLRRA
jgi:DNA-binding winged helix-turn-helix (wHTH) protein